MGTAITTIITAITTIITAITTIITAITIIITAITVIITTIATVPLLLLLIIKVTMFKLLISVMVTIGIADARRHEQICFDDDAWHLDDGSRSLETVCMEYG